MSAGEIARAATVELSTPDGPLAVHEAVPEGAARGGVIVLQDAFGVTSYLEDVAGRLAAAGWHALAPHRFHRSGGPVIDFDALDAAGPHIGQLSGPGVLEDADSCLARLRAAGIDASRTAAVGFCMGGTLAFFLATRRDIGAAACFYGGLGASRWAGIPAPLDDVGALRAPLLGLFGDRDAMIPVADVEQLREALAGLDVPSDVVRYPDADHAFHRDVTPDWYHRASATDAWRRTLDWLERHVPRGE